MPRRSNSHTRQVVFHVLNRAIQGLELFDRPSSFDTFLCIVVEALARHPMRILAYVVMPTHFHFILWPEVDGDLSAFMAWLTGTHAMRWRNARQSSGRGAVYQGRFKAIPVQDDYHLARVLRYVERNPLRARLVDRAEAWPWSSASPLVAGDERPPLSAWPIARPPDWLELLNLPEPPRELEEVRKAIRRGIPFGSAAWRTAMSNQLTWRMRSRPPGRPSTSGHAETLITVP